MFGVAHCFLQINGFVRIDSMTEDQGFVVTARKWRPLRFSDVVGQEHVTTTVRNAIRTGRVHHAYLFTGPRGVGKTTCARILSRALNCERPVDNEPCNDCATCRDVLEGRSVDVIEIDGASNNSVDDVRKLRDNAKYAPVTGKYKLYIIDEVHMLSTAAFNALLKTLEEPPPHLIFVFATTEIHKVPATILSRCQRFDFRRMEISSIVGHLATIASADGITIDEASLVAIARKADGSMRDSQSIFDQVVAFCGTSITSAQVAEALHLVDVDFYFDISTTARQNDLSGMFDLARQVVSRGYDLKETLVGLLEHYRNLLTVVATTNANLIEAAEAVKTRYVDEAQHYSQTDLVRIMSVLSQGEQQLRLNPPQPRVRFEFTLIRLASMDASVDLGELLARLGAGTSQPVGGIPMALKVGPMRSPTRPPTPSPPPPPNVVGDLKKLSPVAKRVRERSRSVNALSARALSEQWQKVLDELPEHLAFVRSTVRQGLLAISFTEVGLVLRPTGEVVYHRLTDKLPDLKEHLAKVYNAPVGVAVMKAQDDRQRAATNVDTDSSDSVADQAASDDLLPIERAIIRLFAARKMN